MCKQDLHKIKKEHLIRKVKMVTKFRFTKTPLSFGFLLVSYFKIINKIIIMNKLIIIKYNIFLLITTTSFLFRNSGGNHQNN